MKMFDVYAKLPLTPVSGKGCLIYDNQQCAYLDLYGGHAVISIGYQHPKYVRALNSQLDKLHFYSNAVRIPLQEKLATKLGKLSGYENYQLFLCNSGTEAVENALRLATLSTNRQKIVCFDGGFHGRTHFSTSTSCYSELWTNPSIQEFIYHHPWGEEKGLNVAITEETAAVIVEGIQGLSGIHLPPDGFLQALREHCDRTGALLVLDEVQSGMGRTGKFYAHQHWGVKADLVTMAKGLGNGFPIGAVIIHPNIKSSFGRLGSTFGGNHLACTAAIASLEILEEENLMHRAEKLGNRFIQLLEKFPGIQTLRGKGLMIALSFGKQTELIRQCLFQNHKILTGTALQGRLIRLLPPLCIETQHIDRFLEALTLAVKQIKG